MENQQHSSSSDQNKTSWEKEVLEKLAFSAIDEQKRTRRWGIFFKLLTFAYLSVLLAMVVYPRFEEEIGGSKEHVAVVDVLGMILEGEAADANNVIEGLRDAIKDKNTKGVILNINSPGGSAVQSAYIYDEIRRQKKLHPDLPIYAVVGDMCASGGYYVAAAADKIYVSPASLIGSIGVVMNGFGFTNVLEKLGVERRLLVAGKNKAFLDPFSPVNQVEETHMQTLLDEVHQQFISAVKEARGGRLKETPDMFSGLVWNGEDGVKLGLADGFGSVDSVAREELGVEEKLNFTPQDRLIDRLAGKFGASFAHTVGTASRSINFQ